jgi:hypothetical protein
VTGTGAAQLPWSHGAGQEHAGRRCRVYPEWIAIETDGALVLIPRDRVLTLRLTPR